MNLPPPPGSDTVKPDPAALRRNLDAQQAAAEALDQLLHREREAILARNWQELLESSRSKEAAVGRLQTLQAELRTLAGGDDDLPARIDALGLGAERQRLKGLAERLQDANRESRTLLQHAQARIGAALQVLQRGAGPTLYGRHGQTGIGRTGRVLAAA